MAADFEQVIVSICLFFIWVLFLYIILLEDSHSLYVFGFYSAVCSHIVGMYSSSSRVTYDLRMDTDLYNCFFTAPAYQ